MLMERFVKITVGVMSAIVVIAVIVMWNLPKDRISGEELMQIHMGFARINKNLPMDVGTVGTLDSMYFSNRSICYDMTVYGDESVIEFYAAHKKQFRSLCFLSYATLNGQNGNGTKLARFQKAQNVGTIFNVFSKKSGDSFSMSFTPDEILNFLESFSGTPTDAMADVIDMQIELANQEINNISSNSLASTLGEGLSLKSLSRKGLDIVWTYLVDESYYDIQVLKENSRDDVIIDALAHDFVIDPDCQALVNSLSISHSNLVLRYEGSTSHECATFRIPYSILKKYSQVPNLQ